MLRKISLPIVFAIFTLIILGVGFVITLKFTNPKQPEDENLLGIFIPEQGREHIPEGTSHPVYTSNPPTSGPHYAQPAQAGIYDSELEDERVIHNLEHGHVWISYKPSSASAELISNLKKVVDENSRMVILSPREANDSLIALASWTRLLKLDYFDNDKIVDFIKTNRGHAPELLP